MNQSQIKQISKIMSLVLRHNPAYLNITLDPEGWANTIELVEALQTKNPQINLLLLQEIVANNDKKRFSFNEDGSKIRANQGHSINIDLRLTPVIPPAHLYHGTVDKFIGLIKQSGLQKMSRQFVHLSTDKSTAQNVGSRRGKPIILEINALTMHNEGFSFFKSENDVWLVDHIPPKYINL